ncbi:MAG: thioredoxin [Clostridia bacterium]|nr:thioredoxin [Clostridia bacterium]MBQ2670500.1 thioredoxin [Clostridia bacterium]MBQ3471007.1 thioredoxin [Clostridia bacterium]MBQ6530559.1 thioredoxin [Clostridia bacterium]MBQ6558285.1 thioredoxin [Clostridia bacterium]
MEINLTSETYEGEVLKSDKPVLVDFWAPWCGPCKMVGPVISEIAEEYEGKVKVCKVNVDECGDLAAANAVVSIPTVIIFVDGKPVKKIIGANPADVYEDALDELV